MENEKEFDQNIDKLEKITKKYRDKYYANFFKKYEHAKNYADFDIKSGKFVLDKDNYRSATKYATTTRKFGNWCNYNCKSGKLLAEQLMVECTETVTSLDYEDLNSSDEWETEESSDDDWETEESSDDEMEDLRSTFHDRQSDIEENNSKECEYSLVKHLAAVSLDEKTQICPLSRRRGTPVQLDGTKKNLRNSDRTQFPTLAKQVSTVQTEVITDDAVKGPLGIGKSHKRKETLISLEVEKKYFRCDTLKECFVNFSRLNVSTIAEPRGLLRNCFVRLTRCDQGSDVAKCQPLNSEMCSEMRAIEKPNKRCIQATSERIVQISNVEKSRGKKVAKCRKSSVTYCKSVYSVKSLIQHGQFSQSCGEQWSQDHAYLEASFNEDYTYFESPRKGKRKSKITEFDDELPLPKRSSNAASNSISLWNGNKLHDFCALRDMQEMQEYHSNVQKDKDRNDGLKAINYLFEE